MNRKKDIEQLFRQHYAKMYNLARCILSDDDESKDVVSEVFAQILADEVVLVPGSEEGYLMRSVRNRCLNLIAHKSVKERVAKLLRQVSFGLLDMAYYTKKDVFTADIIPFEKEAWKEAMILPQLPDTCMTVQFSHIMAGGYAAGYYSYKWAEVLDADAFSVFKKNGIFNRTTAQSFRDNILSKGGTEHPMTLYKRFRGQEPTIDALLERNEIKKS